jgi:hypothetical protein
LNPHVMWRVASRTQELGIEREGRKEERGEEDEEGTPARVTLDERFQGSQAAVITVVCRRVAVAEQCLPV